jgi:hypothetical protein
MYIISETLAGNDPRFHADMERIYSHWLYTSYYVPDSAKPSVVIDNKEMIEVPENVARAVKFGNVNAGKIGIRTGTLAHEEVFGESTEPDGQKTYYYINETDEQNVVQALKFEMTLYLNKHYSQLSSEIYSRFSDKRQTIESEISECSTLIECQKLMHVRFGLESLKGAQTDYNLGPAKFDLSEPGRDNYQ